MKDETEYISFEAKVKLVMLWVYGLSFKEKKERWIIDGPLEILFDQLLGGIGQC